MRKNKIKKFFNKVKNKIWILPTTFMILQSRVFAAGEKGSIEIAEVKQATENIKAAIIKLAMPIRRDFSICKYCDNCTKNDSKFK